MKRVIVNADDFGLHTEVNQGILEGFRRGILRSTSFVASGAAAEEAAEIARENPALGVGIHLTLVAESPVLPPDKVPSLVDRDGRLWQNHGVFIKKYFTGDIRIREVYAECEAQIARAESLGIHLTHIDSHQHLHVLPRIIDIAVDLAKRHRLTKMRLPAEACFFTGGCDAGLARQIAKCGLTMCARMAHSTMRRGGMKTPDHFFGMVAGGQMLPARFMAILKALPDGVSEIMVHPGRNNRILDELYHWHYHWEQELLSVTAEDTLRFVQEHAIEPISFKEL